MRQIDGVQARRRGGDQRLPRRGRAPARYGAGLREDAGALAPQQGPIRGPRTPPKSEGCSTAGLKVVHSWANVGQMWQCTSCLQLAKSPADSSECKGVSDLAQLCSQSNGHRLWAAVTSRGAVVIVCAGCGAYAEGRRRRLALSCPGRPPSAALAAQRSRFWGVPSKHPAARSRQLFVGEPWPILGRSGSPTEDRAAIRREVFQRTRRAPVGATPTGWSSGAGQKRPRRSAPVPAVVGSGLSADSVAPPAGHVVVAAASAPPALVGTAVASASVASRDTRRCSTEPLPASPAKRLHPKGASGSSCCRPSSEAGPTVGSKRPLSPPMPAEAWPPPASEPRASALRRRYGR